MPELFLEFIVHLFMLLWSDREGRQVLLGFLPLTLLIFLVELALDFRRDRSTRRLVGVLAVLVLLIGSIVFSVQNFPS